MHIGFTGTREGMTTLQHERISAFLSAAKGFDPTDRVIAHHGDCIGADSEFHTICIAVAVRIILHPPIDEKLRAFREVEAAEIREAKTHFARNRDIVDETDFLLVCPKEFGRMPRGGTWYTHDYAEKKRKRRVIFWPHGAVSDSAA